MTALGPGIAHRFTDRTSGQSAPPFAFGNLGTHVGDDAGVVARNRDVLRQQTGRSSFIWLDQVHGTVIAVLREIDELPVGPLTATDGVVTDRDDVVLAVVVADCVPVLAGDPVAGVIGVAHAGRKGGAGGIADALVDHMVELGARVGRIAVALGPAICGQCYEVPAELQASVVATLPGSGSTTSLGTPGLDLRAGLRRQLIARGVARVDIDRRCTAQDPELYSYRRDGRTGRQAGLLWRVPPD